MACILACLAEIISAEPKLPFFTWLPRIKNGARAACYSCCMLPGSADGRCENNNVGCGAIETRCGNIRYIDEFPHVHFLIMVAFVWPCCCQKLLCRAPCFGLWHDNDFAFELSHVVSGRKIHNEMITAANNEKAIIRWNNNIKIRLMLATSVKLASTTALSKPHRSFDT